MRNPKPHSKHRWAGHTHDPRAVLAGPIRRVRGAGRHRPGLVRQETLPGEDREAAGGGGRQMRQT